MCTAVSFKCEDHYFGRNLDLFCHYLECITITPRRFPLHFRKQECQANHYAMLGMATITNNYPLYYDAVNEHGLCMAALNFPGNAVYHNASDKKNNIASFELIPWILCQCKDVSSAKRLLENINIINDAFSDDLQPSPLHWMISDATETIVIESTQDGLFVYDNPTGVLTNNPPFHYQIQRLNDYMSLSCEDPQNTFSEKFSLQAYSHGMGALGLPGDLSSGSRFIRATFTSSNSVIPAVEIDCIGQFFHILDSVAQTKGCVKWGDEREYTVYSSCINASKRIYYYTTYESRQICAVKMTMEEIQQDQLIRFPLRRTENICYHN